MRDGWRELELRDIATFRSGKFLPKEERDDQGKYPVYGANGIIGRSNRVLLTTPFITVGRVGACGEVCVVTEPGWVSDNALIVEPQADVLFPYLALLLRTVDYERIRTGTSQPLITQTNLASQSVRLPSIMEQRRIADVVGAIERVRSSSEQALKAGIALRTATCEALVTQGRLHASARSVPLGVVLDRVRRPVTVTASDTYHQIGIRSFGRGFFQKEPVTGSELGSKKIFEIHDGDLAFNIVFAWEGAVALAGEDEHLRVGSHRFPTYRVDVETCDARYLLLYLLSERGRHLLRLHSPGSAGRNRTLNQGALLNERVVLPPLSVQSDVAELAAALDRQTAAESAQAAALADFRDAVAHVLLSGSREIPEAYDRLLPGRVDAAADSTVV